MRVNMSSACAKCEAIASVNQEDGSRLPDCLSCWMYPIASSWEESSDEDLFDRQFLLGSEADKVN